jgi:uncharacterized membrane protein YdbT with pleckstrin-like domain
MAGQLLRDERVILLSHRSGWLLFFPSLALLALTAATGAALGRMPLRFEPYGTWAVLALAVLLLVLLVLRPFYSWLAFSLLVTNRRVILRKGLLKNEEHDVFLNQIQDVAHSQPLLARIVGSGSLLLTATSGDIIIAESMPKIQQLRAVIADLVWAVTAQQP